MSYIVNKTDGNVLVTLLDGTSNADTGLTLIGRNFTGYGEIQNENFVRLLENFASPLPPGQSVGFTPMVGQLWWDTDNSRLRVYNGASFVNVSEQAIGATSPASPKTGDQWFNTVTAQLSVWTGSAWNTIGPGYTAAQGKSGAIVETITDSFNASHTVTNLYTNGNLIGIVSYGSAFTPSQAIVGITTIQPGINLVSGNVFNGTATNSNTVGGLNPLLFAQPSQTTTFAQDVAVVGNIVLTNANIFYSNPNLLVQNKAFNGSVDFYVNSSTSGNTRALRVDGASGLVTVSNNPLTDFGVATKIYVDVTTGQIESNVAILTGQLATDVEELRADYFANIAAVETKLENDITSNVAVLNANITTVSDNLTANVVTIDQTLINLANAIDTINGTLPTLAPTSSPTLTGTPTVPLAPFQSNTHIIASAAYVDRQADVLTNDYIAKVAAALDTANSNLVSGLTPKANIDSPTFTGSPTAPTPTSGDNSTKIATTGFVTSAITAQQFNYTVSSSPPSGGNNGDFWFQVG